MNSYNYIQKTATIYLLSLLLEEKLGAQVHCESGLDIA